MRFKDISIKNKIISNADLVVIRVGGRAGKAFLATDDSDDANVSKQKYNYFIKLVKGANATKIVADINKLTWDKNNTTGPRSIGKYELTPRLNAILN